MSDYTPSTDVIREGYAFYLQSKIAGATFGQGLAEFDAWLAEHDRQVAERAWHEGHSAGVFDKTYGTCTRNPHEATKEAKS